MTCRAVAPPSHESRDKHKTRGHYAPSLRVGKRIGAELRTVWNAASLAKAETALADLVTAYRETAPKLAEWLEENIPEGLSVFSLPEHHRCRLRTLNLIERAIQQERKRRTIKVRAFPNEEALDVSLALCW